MSTAPQHDCPTLCDADCEISPGGCHEVHDVQSHRQHDPEVCEARSLAANLSSLVGAGWRVRFGRHPVPYGENEWYYTELVPHASIGVWIFHGVRPVQAVTKARAWADREGISP